MRLSEQERTQLRGYERDRGEAVQESIRRFKNTSNTMHFNELKRIYAQVEIDLSALREAWFKELTQDDVTTIDKYCWVLVKPFLKTSFPKSISPQLTGPLGRLVLECVGIARRGEYVREQFHYEHSKYNQAVFNQFLDGFRRVEEEAIDRVFARWTLELPTLPSEMRVKVRPRISRDEANVRVGDWLRKNGKTNPRSVTRDDVAKGTGVSTGAVSNSSAWKAFRRRRDEQSKPAKREVPLTKPMLAKLPAGSTRPDELAELIKEQAQDQRKERRRHRPS
jgi:hypothetical protein